MPYFRLGLAGIFYAVAFGAIHADCIGEDSVSLSDEDQENTTINTPSDNVKVRFSCENKGKEKPRNRFA